MFNRFIGVDVAKAKIDVFLLETGELMQIKNDEKSLHKFVQSLEYTKDTLVVIDLTGGYEIKCVSAFYKAGFTIHRAEGRKVKAFMRACGQLAKTDFIDARALADYGKGAYEALVFTVCERGHLTVGVVRTLCDVILAITGIGLGAPAAIGTLLAILCMGSGIQLFIKLLSCHAIHRFLPAEN